MNWDKAWPLYAAAVVVPIAVAIGLWLFDVWWRISATEAKLLHFASN